MTKIIEVNEKNITLETSSGRINIKRTFNCNDVKIHDHTFVIIAGASIENLTSDRIYYPALRREDCGLYHLEYFRSNAKQWKMDKPDNIRLVKNYE